MNDEIITNYLIEIKTELATVRERLDQHIEWEEKHKYWWSNTVFPIGLSAVISFLISIFKQ